MSFKEVFESVTKEVFEQKDILFKKFTKIFDDKDVKKSKSKMISIINDEKIDCDIKKIEKLSDDNYKKLLTKLKALDVDGKTSIKDSDIIKTITNFVK